ncbi:hypothetical protein ACVW0K_000185 [Streptomyces filamentosus]
MPVPGGEPTPAEAGTEAGAETGTEVVRIAGCGDFEPEERHGECVGELPVQGSDGDSSGASGGFGSTQMLCGCRPTR